ncbi:hypothetical protein DHEL01_v209712 [Diaporthe helianthi]|uniref:Uncharacterized protein n=1 Tax=Diaporthe helianthi TaxID=158607 RepID=A0A2P5HNQ6_DIAHE|nr:hypothetical protein DHEL01_v209712 [Diaporthe helianthi]
MKRKEEDKSTASDRSSKRLKADDNQSGVPTPAFTTGKMDGPDDSFITSLFSPLSYSITTFATYNFRGKPYKCPQKAEHKAFFETLTSGDYRDYLTGKHTGAKERIVRALIWNKLTTTLLEAPLEAFNSSQFHAWRAMTAQFLFANYTGPTPWGKNGTRRQEFIKDTADMICKFAATDEREALEEALDEIAEHAYQLAKAMARSGAHWACTMKEPNTNKLHGFKIKTSLMVDEELWNEEDATSKSVMVDLVVAPMLLKYGNSNGQDFGNCRVVERAKVVTKPKKDNY